MIVARSYDLPVRFLLDTPFDVPDGRTVARQKYIACLVLGWIAKLTHTFSACTLPLILQGLEKCKIWRQFSAYSRLEALWFRR